MFGNRADSAFLLLNSTEERVSQRFFSITIGPIIVYLYIYDHRHGYLIGISIPMPISTNNFRKFVTCPTSTRSVLKLTSKGE